MLILKKITLLSVSFLTLSLTGFSQDMLSTYVDSALENNIVLQQKNISLQQAVYALKTAKGLFYPSVGIQADYTTANGGRDISLPIGDMLNGVYTTLNQLTQSHQFPQLENQNINFLPQNFYDFKIHTEVPIINTQLKYNKTIKTKQVQLSQYEITIYKRNLIEKVKTAYYQYLQALEAINVYRSALNLAKENKRMNKSLLENGKGIPAYILRSQSEIEAVEAKITTAIQKSDNAKRYFNFLLNRNQELAIDTPAQAHKKVQHVLQSLQKKVNIAGREELKALQQAKNISKDYYQMKKSIYYPTLNGFLDLGSQAENWKFNNQSRYFMVGVQLKIPLFEGMQNKNKIKSSYLSIKNNQLKIDKAEQQLKLKGHVAQNRLKAAYQNFLSSKKQLESAKTYHRLIYRGYKEGANTYLETIDARNQLTKAKMAVSINKYKVLEAQAKLERATASYKLK